MMAPAPFTRDLLAAVRAAARAGQTVDAYAPRIGWPAERLSRVCRDHGIDMARGQASPAAPAPAPRACAGASARGASTLKGLMFDNVTHTVWRDANGVQFGRRAFNLMLLLAEAMPQALPRPRIDSLFADLAESSRAPALSKARMQIDARIGVLGLQLVRLTDGMLVINRAAAASRAPAHSAGAIGAAVVGVAAAIAPRRQRDGGAA